ncbi:hypothetical protein RIF29_26727 [Crotalaria pallida]|uniref:Acid phosphatase n=1 Tax=Crotalaria pallida TaxID=3830 RepID=A0AAN9HY91_CROPI
MALQEKDIQEVVELGEKRRGRIMGIVGEQLDIDFVISTGDNFYDNGLTGIDDTAFDDSFTNIYTSPTLQKQWYNGKNSNFILNW